MTDRDAFVATGTDTGRLLADILAEIPADVLREAVDMVFARKYDEQRAAFRAAAERVIGRDVFAGSPGSVCEIERRLSELAGIDIAWSGPLPVGWTYWEKEARERFHILRPQDVLPHVGRDDVADDCDPIEEAIKRAIRPDGMPDSAAIVLVGRDSPCTA